MSKKPEALRLAKELVSVHQGHADEGPSTFSEAAAELRRLHEENKLLHERHSFNNKEFVRLHSVNADLLEALKWMVANDDTNEGDDPVERLGGQSWNEYNSYWINGLNKARAAIAKATGVP
jgi:hypothetical protein